MSAAREKYRFSHSVTPPHYTGGKIVGHFAKCPNAQIWAFGHLGGIFDQYENAHWAFGHSGINFDLANSAQICGHSKLTFFECLCDAEGHSSTSIR